MNLLDAINRTIRGRDTAKETPTPPKQPSPRREKTRTAHAAFELDGVKYRFELRPNCDLVIRRDRKRRGVTYTAAELAQLSDRHREGSLRL